MSKYPTTNPKGSEEWERGFKRGQQQSMGGSGNRDSNLGHEPDLTFRETAGCLRNRSAHRVHA
jgi:hypothetical protein